MEHFIASLREANSYLLTMNFIRGLLPPLIALVTSVHLDIFMIYDNIFQKRK